jgi:hypothetical protein
MYTNDVDDTMDNQYTTKLLKPTITSFKSFPSKHLILLLKTTFTIAQILTRPSAQLIYQWQTFHYKEKFNLLISLHNEHATKNSKKYRAPITCIFFLHQVLQFFN